jgi:hypothetical protein
MTVQSGEAVALGERVAQAGREGNVSGERCGELWGVLTFYRSRGSSREGWPGRLMLALMALSPLKALRAVNAQFEGD